MYSIEVRSERDGWFQLVTVDSLREAKEQVELWELEDKNNNEICNYQILDLDTNEPVET